MQISARWKAVLELMETVFGDDKPADKIINEYFRARKYIGSGDRRFITEHIWKIIRNRRKLSFDAQSDKFRDILLCYVKNENVDEVFAGGEYGLETLSVDEVKKLEKFHNDERPYPVDVEAECPEWLYKKINNPELCKTLNVAATADFRINTANRDSLLEKLKAEGLEFYKTPYSPIGIRSDKRINLNNCAAYNEGEMEVQDEASQIASILADVSETDKVIDYCCGAGGKSLAISYLLKNKGRIFVHDVDWSRLEAIKDRADRLGVKNIEIVKNLEDNDFDKFIIDVPCSGSGTWRRSPDAKFRLTPKKLKELNKIQREILILAANHVKKGGKIVYITCSILTDENEDVIESFLAEHKNFKKVNLKDIWNRRMGLPYFYKDDFSLRMNPLTTGTDGFFIMVLEKVSD